MKISDNKDLVEILERAGVEDATGVATTLLTLGWRNSKSMLAEIREELDMSLRSNIRVLEQRSQKPNVIPYEDPLCCMCQGKIYAIEGISRLIERI